MPDLEGSIHLESKTAELHFNIRAKTERGKKTKNVNPSFIGFKELHILLVTTQNNKLQIFLILTEAGANPKKDTIKRFVSFQHIGYEYIQ